MRKAGTLPLVRSLTPTLFFFVVARLYFGEDPLVSWPSNTGDLDLPRPGLRFGDLDLDLSGDPFFLKYFLSLPPLLGD